MLVEEEEKEEDDARVPLDGEENLRPTAGRRQSLLEFTEPRRREVTAAAQPARVISRRSPVLPRSRIIRGILHHEVARPRGKESTDRPTAGAEGRYITTVTEEEEEAPRLLPPRLPYSSNSRRERWCIACRAAFMCAVR